MTQAELSTQPPLRRALANRLFIALAVGAALALILYRGGLPHAQVHWHAPRLELLARSGAVIQLHVAAALTALGVGGALLIGVKGTGLHKRLGWTWVVAMLIVAVSSLFIKVVNPGHWSFIHFFSGWTLIALPLGLAAAKRRNIGMHRRTMTGLFVGGLVVAGAFTFVPGRLMWAVFFG